MKYLGMIIFAALVVIAAAAVGTAGEYHAGQTLLCYDCHTMHFSMQHNWDGTTPVPTIPSVSGTGMTGNWLGSSGPNQFLLKAPPNQLCLACHDGQTFAPDVLAINSNASPTQGREAGALNETATGAPYDTWKGHTLDSTSTPPGFNPTAAGVPATQQYNASDGLECISCHLQHGSATVYRNLGPRTAAFQPTYVLGAANVTTVDVWVNIATPYTAGTGSAATFNPYYDRANISFNKTAGITAPAGSTRTTSNRMDTFCSACHGDFHGGPGDTNIGATIGALDGFIRHPTSNVVIGAAGAQGYGGHSALSRFVAATSKVKVYANDQTAWSDATPGCITCHKSHGNQNPFGLVFLNRAAASVDEQGGWAAGQTQNTQNGLRNLCGQCHGQGN